MGRLTAPLALRLPDADAERLRANHEQRLGELQASHGAALELLAGVLLKDSVITAIPHKLGRVPVWCRTSDVRPSTTVAISATGRIVLLSRDALYVTYVSSGWGTDVLVDIEVA